jgi:versiconal hemiacetal acetate esterase
MSLSESWLGLEAATGGRQPMRGPPHDARAKFAGLIQMLAPFFPPPSGNVETRNGDVDGIGYRIYTPKEHNGSLPLVVFSEHHSQGTTKTQY